MSKLNLYSIEDCVAQSFSQPCSFSSDDVAKRAFGDLVTSSGYVNHKSDYVLKRVGSFDPKTGFITSVDPVLVCSGSQFEVARGDADV